MNIIKGKVPGAKKVVIYGPEGIGKSTFAAAFPDPVFIDTEGSTKDMDVSRFEKASSWAMLISQVNYVIQNTGVCKTLIVDTMDWAEQMCVDDLCAKNGKSGIEDFGYGNGYVYAKESFGKFLNLLEDVIEKGIHVVITAHAHIKKFEQPDEMGAYDRWELKLGKKTSSQTAPLLKEWADMVLFANYKTLVYNVDNKGAQKGKNKVQGGRRVMFTQHHPCWDAKNRYGLPDELPFEYEQIAHVIEQKTEKKVVEEPEVSAPPTKSTESTETTTVENSKPVRESMENKKETINVHVDERVPKKLRDLMLANNVDEWDIQNVVAARGYFPADMEVFNYPSSFINDVLVCAWDKVYGMIAEMKEKDAIVFNN